MNLSFLAQATQGRVPTNEREALGEDKVGEAQILPGIHRDVSECVNSQKKNNLERSSSQGSWVKFRCLTT